jgi:hypothetical protein
MAKATDIEFLPPGWRWVPAGKESWITSEGKISTARHGRNGNEVLSTRQVQNLQRAERAKEGVPKAPTVHRTGKIRTIKNGGPRYKKVQTDVTKSEHVQTGVGTLYNEQRHGYTETWVFYSLSDAQQYMKSHGKPDWANWAILQIRFTDRLNATDRVGSDTTGGPGYATLGGFVHPKFLFGDYVDLSTKGVLETKSPWEEARSRITNYDMTGDKARVYLYLMEK